MAVDEMTSEPSSSDYGRWTRSAGVKSFKLGAVLAHEGDVNGARRALEHAIATGDPQCASKAAYVLGALLLQTGDETGALTAFGRAVDFGYPQTTTWACYRIGAILESRGDTAGSASAFSRITEEFIGMGRALLASEDYETARQLFERARNAGDTRAGYEMGQAVFSAPYASKQRLRQRLVEACTAGDHMAAEALSAYSRACTERNHKHGPGGVPRGPGTWTCRECDTRYFTSQAGTTTVRDLPWSSPVQAAGYLWMGGPLSADGFAKKYAARTTPGETSGRQTDSGGLAR